MFARLSPLGKRLGNENEFKIELGEPDKKLFGS
jgi:hypothetical protein